MMQTKQTTETKVTANRVSQSETTGSTFGRGGLGSVAAMQRRFGNAVVAAMFRSYVPDIQRAG